MEDLWAPYQSMGVDFARHAEDSAYNAHYDRPAVLAALGPVRGLRLLDAGCGPGLYVAELLRAGALVTGFDASPLMVDLARQRVGEAAQIDLALLGEPLPYPDEAFDLAVCALTIHMSRTGQRRSRNCTGSCSRAAGWWCQPPIPRRTGSAWAAHTLTRRWKPRCGVAPLAIMRSAGGANRSQTSAVPRSPPASCSMT